MTDAATVLVIDDSLTIRKLLEMVLGNAGYRVECAVDGCEGLARARRLRPALVLLDHVLPDLKGDAICADLAADPLTAGLPVVVMSGKGEDIRALFRPFAGVAGFLDKPFSPSGVLETVARHCRVQQPARAPTPSGAVALGDPAPSAAPPGEDRREALAQGLYAALRDRLGRIPAFSAELGAQPAAPFYARKLLTPEAMGQAFDILAPLFPGIAPPPAAGAQTPLLAGSTALGGLRAVLRFLAETGRGGVLEVGEGSGRVVVHLQRGEPALVVPDDLEGVQRALAALGHEAPPAPPPGELPPALALVATVLADDGAAADLLQRCGVAILARAFAGPLPYRYRDQPAPPWLARWARPIDPEQVVLARLREVDDWSQIELRVASLDQVCERAPGFADLLPRFDLVHAEQRVLLLVNGRNRVADIVERSGLSTFDVFHILYRLIQVGLAQPRGPAAAPAELLVCGDGLGEPLSRLLGERLPAARVQTVPAGDLVAALARSRPRAVLVCERSADAEPLARGVRERLEVSDTVLVALVDRWDPLRAAALTAAGYDDVLCRPVHVAAIERLIGA